MKKRWTMGIIGMIMMLGCIGGIYTLGWPRGEHLRYDEVSAEWNNENGIGTRIVILAIGVLGLVLVLEARDPSK